MTDKLRGRPTLDATREPSAKLCVRLTTKEYDDAHARALAARVSISEWVRRTIRNPADR